MNGKKGNIIVSKTLALYYSLKSKISKEKILEWIFSILKATGYTGLILFAIYLLLSIVSSIVQWFPQTMPPKTAFEILRMIVEVNGVLIGFSGIIFAQLLWALNSQQNIAYENLLQELSKGDLETYLKKFDDRRRDLIVYVFFTSVLFLGSIINSLREMAIISRAEFFGFREVYTMNFLFWPIMLLIGGIISLLFPFFGFSLIPPPPLDKKSE